MPAVRLILTLTASFVVVGCTTATSSAPTPSPPPPSSSTTTTPPATGEPPSLSPAPDLPAGMPDAYDEDVPSADVPVGQLVPPGTQLTGEWYGVTREGEAIAVAWQVPGDDPFRLARGLAIWRRFDDGGAPWRPVAASTYPRKEGVLGISALVTDVTGDASDDLLVRADTGGSGACATYAAWDLAAASEVFSRDLCDGQLDPSADPVGLSIVESVYEPGDAHCCPSALRTTVLVYEDGSWNVASEETTDL